MSIAYKDQLVYEALTNWEDYQAEGMEKSRRIDEENAKRGTLQERIARFRSEHPDLAAMDDEDPEYDKKMSDHAFDMISAIIAEKKAQESSQTQTPRNSRW